MNIASKQDKVLATALATAMLFSVASINLSTSSAASKPTIAKSVKVSVGGSKKASFKAKGFKIKKVTSKSSDKTVATVKASKKAITVSGITSGKATITSTVKATKKGKTKTYKLKTKVTVSDGTTPLPSIGPLEEMTVNNQATLNAALEGAGNAKITLSTTDSTTFDIISGNYPNVDLIVDTPNAYVNNGGSFRSVTIKALKSNGWTEKGEDNTITVSTSDQMIFDAHTVAKIKSLTYTGTSKSIQTINVSGKIKNLNVSSDEPVNLTLTGAGTIENYTINGGSKTTLEIKDQGVINNMVISSDKSDVSMMLRENSTLGSLDIKKPITVFIDGSSEYPTTIKKVKGTNLTVKIPNAVVK